MLCLKEECLLIVRKKWIEMLNRQRIVHKSGIYINDKKKLEKSS